MNHISKKILVKYSIAFLVLISFFYKTQLEAFPLLNQGFGTLRFIAILYIFIQSVTIFYRIRNDIKTGKSDNITTALTNGFTIIVYFSFFFLFLRYNQVSPIQFFTSISIVAAAIAVVSKEYITSIISGFFISFTKIININDYISIGTIKGRVKEIKLTKLYLESDQGELIILGNEKVFLSDIVNHSQSNKRRVSLEFEVKPSMTSDIEDLEKSLINSLSDYKDQIVDDSFALRVDRIFIDRLCLSFSYNLEKLEPAIEKEIRKKTIRDLIKFIQSNFSHN